METLVQDLRHGARMLAKHRGHAAVAVLTLAVGIGVATAVFSVLEPVLLRSLPYREADRLGILWVDFGDQGQSLPAMSPPDFRDLETASRQFAGFAAGTGGSATLTGEGDPELVKLGRITHDFFPLLGAEPILGRGFSAGEEAMNGPAVVILGHALWRRRFAGDPGVIGTTLEVDGEPRQVVGVMAADFRLLLPPEAFWLKDSDLWTPLQDPYSEPRNRTTLNVLGRLAPGASFEEAQQELDAFAARLREEHQVHALSDTRIRVVPLQQDVVKSVRPSLLLLSGAVGLLLLIACGNVGNLLLVRASSRETEMALRSALGAGGGRLVRQILTESTLIAALGGGLGLLLAEWGVTYLLFLKPARLPRLEEVGIDGPVLAFAAVTALSTVLLFGLAPAIRSSRSSPGALLRRSGGTIGGGDRSSFHRAVVVGEVALSLLLLIAAGLLVRSFLSLREVRPGFTAEGVLTFGVALPRGRYPDYPARAHLYDRLEERLRALPGVRAVGGVSQLPLTGQGGQAPYAYDDETAQRWESVTADARTVTPGYFQAVGTTLRAGRFFDDRDTLDGRLVVIVDETLARKAWPDETAVGRRVQLPVFGPEGIERRWLQVVGVVDHVRMHDLSRELREQVYFPHRQRAPSHMDFAVRAGSDPAGLASQIRAEVRALDPELPVHDLRPFVDLLAAATAQARLTLILIGAFAAVALLLALIGLYGVVSHLVGLRQRELGLRLALGARAHDLFRLVLGDGMRLTLAGVAVGMVGSLLGSRALSSLVFGVSTTDPLTFLGAALLVAGVALLACYLPARRAVRVDPMAVLRDG